MGENKMVFLFVDFADAPANEDARELYQGLVPFAQGWYDEVSYGSMKLAVTPVYQWFRMPRNSDTYNFARGLSFNDHKTYINDAVNAADTLVDFSQFDGVYIIASKNSAIPFSPTWVPSPGQGIQIDGVEVRHVVTLGGDARLAIPNYNWHVIQHETGHLMGLPDLYLYSGADVHAPVGGWDNMGLIAVGAHFTAWQKRKLGWLDEKSFACVTSPSQQLDLSPLERAAGVRGLAIQISQTRAIVAEVRRPIGQDQRLCDSGLLVYLVDSSVANGSGPIVVQRAAAGADAGKLGRCGAAYDATYDLGNGKPAQFKDPSTGVVIEILGRTADDGFTIRVTNPLPIPFFPGIQSVVGASAFGASSAVSSGDWIEVYGRNFTATSRPWNDKDFAGSQAPSLLDGIRVTIGTRPGYISYISPGQINVQVPDGLSNGSAPVVVSNGGALSEAFNIAVAQRAPGILAPPSFATPTKQYVAAMFSDRVLVGPQGLIPGVVSRRAKAGDVIVMYGIGFGATNPVVPAGQITLQSSSLPNVVVRIGGVPAQIAFAGLSPGYLGLYQFNIEIPTGVTGDALLTLTVSGQPLPQTLWLALQ